MLRINSALTKYQPQNTCTIDPGLTTFYIKAKFCPKFLQQIDTFRIERNNIARMVDFFADEYNTKRMIRIAEFEHWFETVYTRPLNVLHDPTYVESGEPKRPLTAHSKPNFGGHVLVGFDVKKISTNQLYIHKKTKMNIQN
uniref:Uncharacterized protein n=1 Tax=Romanomermis culicivorax TaxID=13658 RepID=A0A915KRZ7_ROMCU